MTEKAIQISTDFAVADAERPHFTFADHELVLTFTDWHEQKVVVCFKNCVAFKWQEADSSGPEDRDDITYEIMNSEWIRIHLEQNMIFPQENHRHFKLCFNAAGVLEVIASEMEAQPPAPADAC